MGYNTLATTTCTHVGNSNFVVISRLLTVKEAYRGFSRTNRLADPLPTASDTTRISQLGTISLDLSDGGGVRQTNLMETERIGLWHDSLLNAVTHAKG